ncbi:hypothetical protein PMAYCL1PPCAC_17494, partial [Pristionchus mayeri]
RLLFLFLLLSSSLFSADNPPNNNNNGGKRQCFNTTEKKVYMTHANSLHSDWRISPQNYWAVMHRKKKTLISRISPKNEDIPSAKPDKEVITELVNCPADKTACCIVDNYHRVEYRRYQCGDRWMCDDQVFIAQGAKDIEQ